MALYHSPFMLWPMYSEHSYGAPAICHPPILETTDDSQVRHGHCPEVAQCSWKWKKSGKHYAECPWGH